MRRYGEILGRYGEIRGDMGRYGGGRTSEAPRNSSSRRATTSMGVSAATYLQSNAITRNQTQSDAISTSTGVMNAVMSAAPHSSATSWWEVMEGRWEAMEGHGRFSALVGD